LSSKVIAKHFRDASHKRSGPVNC